jgi:YD repeat-containing protein
MATLIQADHSYILTYDEQSNLSELTDPLVQGFGLTYNPAGRPTLLSQPDREHIGITYDASGKVASLTPPGRPSHGRDFLTFAYDADGLLKQAGALTLQRNGQNGLLSGTKVGVVNDTFSYDTFGELMKYTAEVSATSALSIQLTRDSSAESPRRWNRSMV